MPELDPKTTQRFLFSNIDILTNIIYGAKNKDIKKNDLHSEGTREGLTQKQVSKILFAQRSLATNSGAQTAESAKELFQNKPNTDGTVDFKYSINHYMYVSFPDGVFYFNIDELNSTNGGKFFISSVDIQNDSKDIFTNRSNYTVKLKIYFTFFDDLLGNYVKLRSINNKDLVKYMPLIKIIYPYYSKGVSNNSNIPKEYKEQNGFILSQELNFIPETARKDFKNTVADIGNAITKNYHLTNKKHAINIFGSNDPIFKRFENEIYIEYVAFEADSSKKAFTNNNMPSTTEDIFNILKIRNFKDEFANISYEELGQAIKTTNEQIDKYQKDIECYNLYSDPKKVPAGQKRPDVDVKKTLENIQETNKRYENLKFLMKRLLLRYIIESCDVYELECPSYLLMSYRKLDALEAFTKKFDWSRTAKAAGTGFVGGALLGIAGSPVAAAATGLGGSAVAAGIDVAAQAAESFNQYLYSVSNNTRLDGKDIRITKLNINEVLNIKGLRTGQNSIYGKQFEETNITIPDAIAASKQTAVQKADKTDRQVQDELFKNLQTPEQLTAESPTTKVRFIMFRNIADFLTYDSNFTNSNSTKIFYGGNVVYINEQKKSIFYNYGDMPISLTAFFNFLKTQIMDKDTLSLDTEVFVRDAFEALVKSAIKLDQSTTTLMKELIPSTVRMHSQVVKQNSFTGCKNLLDVRTVAESRKALTKGSILKAVEGKLQKIYFFIGEEELKYYNFYDEYQNYPTVPAKQTNNFSSNAFQNFILEEHNIPCILLNYVGMEETILKQKQIVFSRIDNSNLVLGNNIEGDNTSILRLPYQFNTKLKAYMTFFTDIASFIFVAPPYTPKDVNINTFGYGGLYMVTKSSFEYNFQRIVNGKPTIPNLDASVNIIARRITDGTAIRIQEYAPANKNEEECKKLLVTEPMSDEELRKLYNIDVNKSPVGFGIR